ncbi:MAG: arginine--tRNA ligase [Candidatus Aenigmarchaeota archaeon]|nr:arginine--tRNA ligase [Candidatus Aenigmarchaeota archaeon]
MNPFEEFREEVREGISKAAKIKKDGIVLEKPPQPEFGDLAFPCFILSKKLKKSPDLIAKELHEKLKPPSESLMGRIEPKGGYLNFFANWDRISQIIVESVLKEKENFGKGEKKKKNVMVEYCHFNTHKAVHIGHIRTACLGESLSRILEFSGYKVIRANYQGDIGPHVARCIWGFLKIHNGKEPKEDKGKWLGRVYAEASKKLKENEEYLKEADEVNKKIYASDPKLTKIWKKTRKWSLDYFDRIYGSFGIKFDRLYFESEVEKPGTEISKKLLKKGIAKQSEGAIMMDLEKHGLDVFLLVKSDGTPLYSAKDLGLAGMKSREYKTDRSIHVVGSEQKLYFQQLFKTFELMKSPLANKSYHLCYELVNLPTGKMASREGEVILYEDVLKEIVKHAKEETKKRNPKMEEKKLEEVSRDIALASLKYDMIKMSPSKTIIFDWKSALDFEGNAAPYLQYTHARACSILRKAGEFPKKFDISLLKEPHERHLFQMLSEFPDVVRKSGEDMRPHYIANFCYELSTKFNEFYQFLPVLKAKEGMRPVRLALVKAVSIVLKNALNLLGIEALERM